MHFLILPHARLLIIVGSLARIRINYSWSLGRGGADSEKKPKVKNNIVIRYDDDDERNVIII